MVHFGHPFISVVCPPVAPNFPGSHTTHTGVVSFFQYPTGQSEDASMHRPVEGSHIVPTLQSEADSGHIVAAFSPEAAQQQRRSELEVEALHEELPDDVL